MSFKEKTVFLFESAYERLKPYHTLLQSKTPIIAFSGGKDSTLLVHFYHYLSNTIHSPEPILFHLNHGIRNNSLQEEEIRSEMKRLSTKTITKKKTFQNFLND
ncbi:MAG TPA: ATP-binding protein [Leptospiraceae bacterium]|nr:ATP-binding protein [Leptospiraceae bacterium]HRG75938.1 ATP-binding protein [Leptospiraceae bacterium]